MRWTGSDDLDVEADVHIDEFEGVPEPDRRPDAPTPGAHSEEETP